MLVWNHMSGRWLVLHWWTDDERGHLVFAKNEKSLRHLASAVFSKHTDAEVRAVLHIELVAPSDKMVALAREHDEIEKADTFFFEVTSQLRMILEAGKPLPPPFAICDRYVSSDPDEEPTASNVEGHYDCVNCEYSFVLGMTKRELYARYHERWNKIFHKPQRPFKPSRPEPKRVESRAPKAADDEPLWFALANFGHHAGGVELHEVDLSDPSYRPRCLSSEALFFFRLLDTDDLLMEELAAKVKDAADREREVCERRDAERKRAREAEEAQRIEQVIAFFSDATCHGSPPS